MGTRCSRVLPRSCSAKVASLHPQQCQCAGLAGHCSGPPSMQLWRSDDRTWWAGTGDGDCCPDRWGIGSMRLSGGAGALSCLDGNRQLASLCECVNVVRLRRCCTRMLCCLGGGRTQAAKGLHPEPGCCFRALLGQLPGRHGHAQNGEPGSVVAFPTFCMLSIPCMQASNDCQQGVLSSSCAPDSRLGRRGIYARQLQGRTPDLQVRAAGLAWLYLLSSRPGFYKLFVRHCLSFMLSHATAGCLQLCHGMQAVAGAATTATAVHGVKSYAAVRL